MTIGNDDKLADKLDDAFGDFLKKHRPRPPSVPEGEEERIWRAITTRGIRAGMGANRGFAGVAMVMTAVAVVAVVIVVFMHGMNGVNGRLNLEQSFDETRMDVAEDTTLDAVEQALDLRFLENGEINEVTELAAIGE